MNGFDMGKIHRSAIISESAVLGKSITIGANAIIYDNVSIGNNVIIGPNCIIGEPLAGYYSENTYKNPPLRVGSNSIVRSGSILYAGSTISEHFETGHRVTIREHTVIGHHCRVGTLSDIQGFCEIGNYTRLHSNVHVGQKTTIGEFVWIFPFVVLTNDPSPPSNILLGVMIQDFVVIGSKAIILAGITIGRDAVVGAMAMVRTPVLPETVVAGNPARKIASILEVKSKKTGDRIYPWREHFDRGMPWQGIGYEAWLRDRSGLKTDS